MRSELIHQPLEMTPLGCARLTVLVRLRLPRARLRLKAPSELLVLLAPRVPMHLAQRRHEIFAVLFLDSQNRLIALEEMFRGTLTIS